MQIRSATPFQMVSGQQTVPVFAPAGTEISTTILSVNGIVQGAVSIDYTNSADALVAAGNAVWITSALTYSTAGTFVQKVYASCWVRINCTSGSAFVIVDPSGNTITPAASPFASPASPMIATLSNDYALRSQDDQTIFSVTAPIVVTVGPLAINPAVQFVCIGAGSVTLRSSGGVTFNGSTNDVVKNAATDPAGFALVPLYGASNQYGTTSGTTTFAALGGNPTDNANFNTWALGYQTVAAAGNKQSANYTLSSADHAAFVWLAAQAADKTFTFPSTLPNNFRVRIGYINSTSAAGRLKLATSGTSFVWTNNIATGALLNTSPIFMGTASTTNIAVADVYHEGSAPGNTFIVAPVCGVFANA